jgi:hypothetical protein
LSLSVAQWRQLAAELQAIEQEPHKNAVPVEKQLERDRAGEQVQALVSAALAQARELSDEQSLAWTLPLVRTTAKFLLTACDRLRRSMLHKAWEVRAHTPGQPNQALEEVRKWDHTMRELSTQHGVIHPLGEMVEPLRLSESELATLGVPCESLLNGQDLLAL